jgi:ABC-type sugar transport system permease subunit
MLRTKSDPYVAYAFLLPALLVYVVFTMYPFVSGIVISTYRWDGVTPRHFVGIGNYVQLASDTRFLTSLGHNVLYALGSVTGKIALGFIFALLLNAKIRGMTVYRTLYFTPVVMSFVAVGLLWRWLYNPVFGLFDFILQGLGLTHTPVGWLSNPHIALWSVVIVDTWKWTGYHTVIFLAGLQTIPDELYEAAEVDGASILRRIAHITLPSIRSITTINITIALMGAFSVFDPVYVITGGGPYNSSEVLLTYMYLRTFQQQELGYGTAMIVVLFVVAILISLWQQRFRRIEG